MERQLNVKSEPVSLGDASVDGLLAGIFAGAAMAAYLVLATVVERESPASLLSRFDPGSTGSWLTGLVAHLAVSAIYGLLFSIVYRLMSQFAPGARRWRRMSGIGYGALLFLIARFLLLPVVDSPLMGITAIHFALSHAIYGLLLGVGIGRFQNPNRA